MSATAALARTRTHNNSELRQPQEGSQRLTPTTLLWLPWTTWLRVFTGNLD
ncbi:hypothetical protein VFPPC_16555 [Pochonia chlamydosporia 170]|uniref:Uncharacterized protein n=1 Tax=Pochonia chlamydosporia 170 TaxID=1380566 RepID=A0A179F8W8_METCM|nr:hypothetical protein VFPPC_16555 [Pochonia chlamydosporia 170]OAQ61780.1 hypothetical protein VFPPC_16555 [Pochonia chlamydosporia 170]